MKWIRSFPDPVPPRKSHVIDGMERFYHTDYDYSNLVMYGQDILLIEWDLALGKEGRDQFEFLARQEPEKVLVAPYKLYEARDPWCYAHRRVDRLGHERWVHWGERECEYFGFGVIYLPLHLMQAFLSEPKETRGTPIGVDPDRYTDYRFIDQTFSVWHHRQGLGPVTIAWDVLPVHLNEGKWQS